MRRPLIPVAILYAVGILLARNAQFSPWVPVLLAGVLLIPGLIGSWPRWAVLGALIVCVGAAGYALHTAPLSPFDLRRIVGTNSALVTVRGRLLETPTVRVAELDGSRRSVSRIEVKEVRLDREEWRRGVGKVVV